LGHGGRELLAGGLGPLDLQLGPEVGPSRDQVIEVNKLF
jgi:hypothetical protein